MSESLKMNILVIFSLTSLVLCIRVFFPKLFFLPAFTLYSLLYKVIDYLRIKIKADFEDGIVASRKQIIFYKLLQIAIKLEKEILNGIDKEREEMKAYPAGKTIEYVVISQDNREAEKPFKIKMKKQVREDVMKLAEDRVALDKNGRVKSLRTQKVSYNSTLAQIVSWTGLVDDDGKPLEFNPASRAGSYDLLPIDVQEELELVFGGGGYDATAEEKLLRAEIKRKKELKEEMEEDDASDASDASDDEN